MKTILEHLNDLPEGIRERAIKNYEAETDPFWLCYRGVEYATLRDGLGHAFPWSKSPEGTNYWMDIHDDLPTESPDTLSESKIEALEKELEMAADQYSNEYHDDPHAIAPEAFKDGANWMRKKLKKLQP